MKAVAWGVGAVLLLALMAELAGWRWNSSHSMPHLVYRLLPGPVERGAVVMVCPEPGPLQELARQRGYIGYSFRCPGGFSPVIKKIVAVPGDQVRFAADQSVIVNDMPLKHSQRQLTDSHGRAMPGRLPAVGPVPTGRMWVMSDYNHQSWDSRYFGSIAAVNILGIAHPVF